MVFLSILANLLSFDSVYVFNPKRSQNVLTKFLSTYTQYSTAIIVGFSVRTLFRAPFYQLFLLCFFCLFFFQCSASEIFSPHGTVSSNKMTCFFSILHENLFSSSPLLLVIFLYLYLLSFRLNTS